MTHNRLNLQVFKTCLLVIIFIYASNASTSQNPVSDSLKTKRSSVADSAMIDYTKRLAQIEALHIADSLKRIELENELNSIRSTDAFSKHQLLEQLNALTTRDSLRYISKKNRIDSLRAVATGEPVMGFFNDTLFLIYQGFGSFTVNERAKTIADRIHKLAGEFYFATDSIKIFSAETSTNLICGESIIMVVNENDAIWNGTNKETLAESYKQVISEAVLRYKSETSMMEWLKKIGLTLVFFLIIFLIVKYTIRLFNRLLLFIESQEGKRLKGLNIRNYTLFDARRQVNMVKVAAKIAKWFTVVFLVYISLPFLFSIFPWTEGLTSKLLGYIFDRSPIVI